MRIEDYIMNIEDYMLLIQAKVKRLHAISFAEGIDEDQLDEIIDKGISIANHAKSIGEIYKLNSNKLQNKT